MATQVRPLEDRVIVKGIEDQEQKSAGGIITPDTVGQGEAAGRKSDGSRSR